MTDQPVQPEATTKAGQAMEAWLREPENYEWGRKVTNAILAIEAEAVAAFVTRPESKFGASQARQIALEAAQIAREFAAVMDRLTDALASQERPQPDHEGYIDEFGDQRQAIEREAAAPAVDVERLAEAAGNVLDGRRIGSVRLYRNTITPDDWSAITDEYDRLGGVK
jgi:alkylhydroperoxidase family enzyme